MHEPASVEPSRPERSAAGREALLSGAITVGVRDGLSRLSYRSVAEEVGVSHGLVRHHFGSLEDLLAEALLNSIGASLSVTGMALDRANPAAFNSDFAELAEQHANLHAFQYEVALESRRRPKLRAAVERYYTQYRDMVKQRLSLIGIDDDGIIDLVWFVFDGLVFRQVTDPDTAAAQRALEQLDTLLSAYAAQHNTELALDRAGTVTM